MHATERLQQLIEQEYDRLRAGVPVDREAAVMTLVRALDRLARASTGAPLSDLVTGRHLTNLGGNRALQLCLEAAGGSVGTTSLSDAALDDWASQLLDACGRLAEAELVLAHCATGFMRLLIDDADSYSAWIATNRTPTSWRERADSDWWAAMLTRQQLPAERDGDNRQDAGPGRGSYRRLAQRQLQAMSWQLSYPDDAVIGGCSIRTYRAVLGELIARALEARASGGVAVSHARGALEMTLAASLRLEPAVVRRALAACTLTRESAAYHAVPAVAAAPLIEVGADQIVWSTYGLTTEPLLFLARELRRRFAQEYHNAAMQRETVFRRDLYALFDDPRFVTSAGRIELRREAGDVRTDIDAVVFDRRTGTLGLFELKSQDPFARSTAELARQRDTVLYANRQISGVLAWIQRHGADALLNRVDARVARTFRAHRVYPFVLGRYVAHFTDGPEPDRRAAWGTWPQLLRLLDGQPVRAGDANPIASLFNRIVKDAPVVQQPAGAPERTIDLGSARLNVYPSHAAYRSASGAGVD